MDAQRLLAGMSHSLGVDGFPGGERIPFLITYDYVESGTRERCGFICQAESVRQAAESFWNQHPGEWFQLISVNGGGIECYWVPERGTFVTIPGREGVE